MIIKFTESDLIFKKDLSHLFIICIIRLKCYASFTSPCFLFLHKLCRIISIFTLTPVLKTSRLVQKWSRSLGLAISPISRFRFFKANQLTFVINNWMLLLSKLSGLVWLLLCSIIVTNVTTNSYNPLCEESTFC